MSDDDALMTAFGALREETSPPALHAAAAATRRRVLLAASERRRKRLVLVRYAVPIAAVLALGTAWAALGGRRAAPSSERGEARAPDVDAGAVVLAAPDAARLSEVDASPLFEVPDAPVVTRSSPPRARPAGDPEEDLYRVGHRAHFAAHDESASLAAWNAYLARYPEGRFAPEAHYNRALAFVSLGRTSEARDALAPFASGEMGGYRQSEAQALLRALKNALER